MKRIVAFILALSICVVLTGCTETEGSQHTDQQEGEHKGVEVQEGKAESYIFTGTWISDDEQTVVPITVHLYEDGAVVEECHENKAGTWSENEDGSLTITIGADEYTAKFSDVLKTWFFRINEHIGDEEFSLQLTVPRDPSKVAEETNQALIDSIRQSEAEEEYTGEGGEVIFYGGSNFQKWTTLEDDLSEYAAVNKSIGGSNDPVRRAFIEERVYSRKPAVVFYMSSSNDWTSGQSKEDIAAYKQEMFDEMGEKLPDTVYVILSATPNPLRYFGEYHDGMVYVDEWTKEYCEDHDHFEFLNVVPALSLNGGESENPDIWQSDRLHLNEAGYAILAELVRDKLAEIENNYDVTFAAVVEIEDDGEAQRANWTTDWTKFDGWHDEDFDTKTASYQLSGKWTMEGDHPMVFYFLADLYSDGSVRISQHSPDRGDNEYYGYWTERDTEKGNRITLATVSETPTGGEGELVDHAYTYKFFEDGEKYTFSFDFGIIPGAYMRAAELSGGAGANYRSVEDVASALR